MRKQILIACIAMLFVSGCQTGINNTPGVIRDKGQLGITEVVGVGNAESPATLDKDEETFLIEHKEGDVLEYHYVKDDMYSNVRSETTIKYTPKEGAKSTLSNITVKASTGKSWEDKAARIREMLKNTKTIQYVGIGLILGGIAIGWIYKSPGQGIVISGAGVGMVILQSTLANPIWAWLAVGAVIILPCVWFYHMFRSRKLNKKMIAAIEEYKEQYPDSGVLLDKLRGKMDESEKKMVKEIKLLNK